jgi:phosphoribosylamine--glycine ligase/phosphoribosylformylglycinamidine cyclo-ligase
MLFTGLMMIRSGPKVLEYSVRFGDPDTQTLLPLLSVDTDLAEVMVACIEHWLDAVKIRIDPKFPAAVVVAAGGYPGPYAKGIEINLDVTEEGKDGRIRYSIVICDS